MSEYVPVAWGDVAGQETVYIKRGMKKVYHPAVILSIRHRNLEWTNFFGEKEVIRHFGGEIYRKVEEDAELREQAQPKDEKMNFNLQEVSWDEVEVGTEVYTLIKWPAPSYEIKGPFKVRNKNDKSLFTASGGTFYWDGTILKSVQSSAQPKTLWQYAVEGAIHGDKPEPREQASDKDERKRLEETIENTVRKQSVFPIMVEYVDRKPTEPRYCIVENESELKAGMAFKVVYTEMGNVTAHQIRSMVNAAYAQGVEDSRAASMPDVDLSRSR